MSRPPQNYDPSQGFEADQPDTSGQVHHVLGQFAGNNQRYHQQQAFPAARYGAHGDTSHPLQRSGDRLRSHRILGAVIALVVIAGGGYFLVNQLIDNSALKEGLCMTATGTTDNAHHERVNCDSEEFSYLITKVYSTTNTDCGEGTISYRYSSGSRRTSNQKTVCLIPNFKSEKCYNELSDARGYELAACGSAEFKVISVAGSETVECVTPALPWAAGERTFCVEDLASGN